MKKTEYNWSNVPTEFISAPDITFSYRELSSNISSPPLVLLNHLAAVLDNWDPRIIDALAKTRHIVVFNNRGIGATTGKPSDSIEEMADDALTFLKLKKFKKVDLLGFSMGGMVAQEMVLKEPNLIRKLILAGTGSAGDEGISEVSKVSNKALVRGLVTRKDPKFYLFFPQTIEGKASANQFLLALQNRKVDKDKKITINAYHNQLKALKKWGTKIPLNLSEIHHSTLIVNGDNDLMVPTKNSYKLAKKLKNSSLIIYPNAGHGSIFQFHTDFTKAALHFLNTPEGTL